jgi:hypothetical protein
MLSAMDPNASQSNGRQIPCCTKTGELFWGFVRSGCLLLLVIAVYLITPPAGNAALLESALVSRNWRFQAAACIGQALIELYKQNK